MDHCSVCGEQMQSYAGVPHVDGTTSHWLCHHLRDGPWFRVTDDGMIEMTPEEVAKHHAWAREKFDDGPRAKDKAHGVKVD